MVNFVEQLGEARRLGCIRIRWSIRSFTSQRLVLFRKDPGKAQGTCIRHVQIYIKADRKTSTTMAVQTKFKLSRGGK